ncbi:MAG: ADP-forming succinate--CoA ligase subunit beta [Candidatus Hydrogenedentota bacterium]|nr:MAG: ADP-forming succinate--CoA ligase subunit beta [Candidatus Hydrogenedentota bacterium]
MKIHEYQAKALLKEFGAAVPRGRAVDSVEEAVEAWRELGRPRVAVKAQIHAGGRGKGGGIKLAETEEDVRSAADSILGMTLVTHQTGPEGRLVKKVLIEEAVAIEKEFYAAVTLDRARGCPILMASREGGMEIEEVAARNPEAILKVALHPLAGIRPFEARSLAFALGLHRFKKAEVLKEGIRTLTALARLFLEKDASLVEVNPLAVLEDGRVVAADGKVNFDDSALFRHPEIEALRDEAEEEPAEREARSAGLSYVKLDGTIGCMVNGAGLAMATMDIVKHFGAEPANFLDVGGSAKRKRVAKALEIILADPNVKGIFINIFGGIVRCDEVAHGIVAAKKELGIEVPVTIRLTGTNEEEGRRILEEAGFAVGKSLNEAAEKAVAVLK